MTRSSKTEDVHVVYGVAPSLLPVDDYSDNSHHPSDPERSIEPWIKVVHPKSLSSIWGGLRNQCFPSIGNRELNHTCSSKDSLLETRNMDQESSQHASKPAYCERFTNRDSTANARKAAVASLVAAVTACGLLHPLDLIKARMQGEWILTNTYEGE